MTSFTKRYSSRIMTKAEEIEIPEEDRATNFNKPSIKRYIAKLPGKDDIRGKNPQMKMIGPEVEDAMRRKNYVSFWSLGLYEVKH